MMEKLIKKLNNRKGFTLIELIVVIAILGILAAILIPQFSGFQVKAKSSQVMVNAKQIATAADALYVELNDEPTASAIVNVAGPDINASEITSVGTAHNGHVPFTYVKDLPVSGTTYTFTAQRATDGAITINYVKKP